MITSADVLQRFSWYGSLKHGGLLIAPSRLPAHFGALAMAPNAYVVDRLRTAIQNHQEQGAPALAPLLDTVLETLLAFRTTEWQKASAVEARWSHRGITGETLRPRRLRQGPHGAILPVFTDDVKQLGIGVGRRSVARVVEWLRKSDLRIALLTNGFQWRLIHAGADYEAWCEWDTNLWFAEGKPSEQVEALLHLLSPEALTPKQPGATPPLLTAIQDSRKGQAELSNNLGERVRLAVEHLIHSSGPVIDYLRKDAPAVTPRDVYIAATRLVMRCVVVLFAEARDLLPRTDPVYNDSYSLQGLRDQLDRMAGGRAAERLRHQWGAWPRLLSLFQLIYKGSSHKGLLVRRYGGGLFQPGKADSPDPILRALALFEHPDNAPPDSSIHRILDLLTRAYEKIPQGRKSQYVLSPIDFSDLSTEYIGILYEGLLDFQLKRADIPIVFLNVGDEPALPFSQLEAMAPADLAKLFEKFKAKDKKSEGSDDGDDAEDDVAEDEPETTDDSDQVEGDETDDAGQDGDQAENDDDEQVDEGASPEIDAAEGNAEIRERILAWARGAAEVAGLTKKPRGKLTEEKRAEYENSLSRASKQLVPRVIYPGEWYLVREGNTRKGSGTFYTRPQLAGPITRRALRELAYDGRTPRKPEEILALKVCDPACGSGSFLLSALRFLTDALVESLHVHGRFRSVASGVVIRLADGEESMSLADETIPKPLDDPEFNDYLRAYLRRYIVERCLYGVDLDPLAVELGRLALWIETMDPRLPFGFLDHKVKCGNALIGCWFDRFQDYPIMAWERDGGDSKHERFVHHFRTLPGRGKKAGEEQKKGDRWTFAIKQRKDDVKAELLKLITLRRQDSFAFIEEQLTPSGVHDQLVDAFEEIHALPIHDAEKRRELYDRKFGFGSAYRQLRAAFDTWCAVWFWPADHLEDAPMPGDFLKPSAKTLNLVRTLRAEHRFFHWELEFPDVFQGEHPGFHAVIGNPPWEVQKPNSKEFFSGTIDPLYRGYGKQEALRKQSEYFANDASVETRWLQYSANLKARSNWVKYVRHPFGDHVTYDANGRPHHEFPLGSKFEVSKANHEAWKTLRKGRAGFADARHPFLHQGSADLNTYKMFLEMGHALLRAGGRLGLLVPSGIYSDKGAGSLRSLFLKESRWSHLYAFQNERFIFAAVDHRFKVAAVQVEKEGKPGALRTRFRLGPGDSPEPHELEDDIPREAGYLPVSVEEIAEFSPNSGAILEIRSQRDLEIVRKLYRNGILLGDKSESGWKIRYTREFDMTNDSKLFPPRVQWEAKGYRADEYGHWLLGGWQAYSGEKNILKRPKGLILSADGGSAIHIDDVEDVALPLYQGAMIHQFDFASSSYERTGGKRGYAWIPQEFYRHRIQPQYLMGRGVFTGSDRAIRGTKLAFRDVARSTDSQTFVGAFIPPYPCNHKTPLLGLGRQQWPLLGQLNSLVADWLLRQRMAGTNLTLSLLEELSVLSPRLCERVSLIECLSCSLSLGSTVFAREWLDRKELTPWRSLWAISPFERLRCRATLEAVIGHTYGLSRDEFRSVFSDCDHPLHYLARSACTRAFDPKGFWRVQRGFPPELRFPVMAQVVFDEIGKVGFETYLDPALSCRSWQPPNTIRLADYELGRDDRAKEHQPVAAALGPQFYPWQLEQSVEESWEECGRHAEILSKLVPSSVHDGEANGGHKNEPRPAEATSVQLGLF